MGRVGYMLRNGVRNQGNADYFHVFSDTKATTFHVLMRVNRFCYARLENIAITVINSMRPMNSEVFSSNLFPLELV